MLKTQAIIQVRNQVMNQISNQTRIQVSIQEVIESMCLSLPLCLKRVVASYAKQTLEDMAEILLNQWSCFQFFGSLHYHGILSGAQLFYTPNEYLHLCICKEAPDGFRPGYFTYKITYCCNKQFPLIMPLSNLVQGKWAFSIDIYWRNTSDLILGIDREVKDFQEKLTKTFAENCGFKL